MTLLASPPKFTSLSTARQLYHWPAYHAVNFEFACFTYPFPPIHESSTVWKVSFTGDKQFTNGKISNINSLHKFKIPVLSIIPLLCRIWPGFKQKSSLFFFANKVLEWYEHVRTKFSLNLLFHLIFLDDKIRTTVQLITYTVPQNCLSLFTISQFTLWHYLIIISINQFTNWLRKHVIGICTCTCIHVANWCFWSVLITLWYPIIEK